MNEVGNAQSIIKYLKQIANASGGEIMIFFYLHVNTIATDTLVPYFRSAEIMVLTTVLIIQDKQVFVLNEDRFQLLTKLQHHAVATNKYGFRCLIL